MHRDVGVVILRLGKLADAVHEPERSAKVRERERSLESAVDLAPALRSHGGSIYDRRQSMTVSTENALGRARERSGKRRPGRELAVEAVFGPLANALVRVLVPLKVPPPAVVLANAAAGLLAAFAIVRGELVLAALLLQLKTLLDNADGRLARASGRVSALGRYLDTEADLLVNAALFAGLAAATGRPWLALVGFFALTLVLSADFNVERLYHEARGEVQEPPAPSASRAERVLARIYGAAFAPQDRLVRAIVSRRLELILSGEQDSGHRRDATLAYHDPLSVAILANLGLSTQLAVLGVCLVLGAPSVYLGLAVAGVALLPLLQLRRERIARHVLAG